MFALSRNRATEQDTPGCADARPYPGGPVTGPNAGNQGRLGLDGALLRRRLADVAASIASTEDHVAETLERMALACPEDAIRLQAHAERARRFAVMERDRATSLSLPALAPSGGPPAASS